MKKTLIAIGLLGAFGVAQAETSVQLYGMLNLAVTKKGNSGVRLHAQEYRYASHIGLKGTEDLGNGFAAIFKLEAELQPDIGAGKFGTNQTSLGFDRQAWVGLKTPFGAFRFGRSTTPVVNMWLGGDFTHGRGVGEFTAGIAGAGLRTTQPEVGIRWNNAMFYDLQKTWGHGDVSHTVTAGAAITTKGSQSVVPTGTRMGTATLDQSIDNEGKPGTHIAWGAYARYNGTYGKHGFKIGAAFQRDNGNTYAMSSNTGNGPAEGKQTWIGAIGYSYGPIAWTAGYAQVTIDNTRVPFTAGAIVRTGKSKTFFTGITADLTPRDKVYLSYGRYKRHNNLLFSPNVAPLTNFDGYSDIAGSQYSLGYSHEFSKRTVFYTNVRMITNIKNQCRAFIGSGEVAENSASAATRARYAATCGATRSYVDGILKSEKGFGWDIGIAHSF